MDKKNVTRTKNPVLDSLCHQASWGPCTAPALRVWLTTRRRIPWGRKGQNHVAMYFMQMLRYSQPQTFLLKDFLLRTFSLVMSRSATEYLSHLMYVLTVYSALWNCLSMSVNSSNTLLADHSSTYGKETNNNLGKDGKWTCQENRKRKGRSTGQVESLLCHFTWLLLDSTSHI